MGALQDNPTAFGRNFQNQLAQLPTTGNNAAVAASQGERFVKHVLIAMPESQYDPLLFNKAVNKMVEGMADSQRVSVQKVRRQMRKGWGQVDNGEDELSEIETDRLVILIN
jgi:hypothetical protein